MLIGEEPYTPYQRPALSKKFLTGQANLEHLLIRSQQWFEEQGVATILNSRAMNIDRAKKQVFTDKNEIVEYDKLLLCTGSRARSLPDTAGGNLKGVHTLRSIADAVRLRAEIKQSHKMLVVGGGYLGLEVAATVTNFNIDITLIEAAERILQRIACAETSNLFRDLHRSHGVDIRESAQIKTLLESNGQLCGVQLCSGEIIEASLALVAIGNQPNIELAEMTGLDCNNGIAVTAGFRSSDPNIYAAGDCTSFVKNGKRIRLESVQNASEQGALAAQALAGQNTTCTAVPWFWSEQYDSQLQIAGLNHGYNRTVLRQAATERACSLWYYANDKLLAVDAINDPKSFVTGRKLIELGLHPAPQQVSNPKLNLMELVKSAQPLSSSGH